MEDGDPLGGFASVSFLTFFIFFQYSVVLIYRGSILWLIIIFIFHIWWFQSNFNTYPTSLFLSRKVKKGSWQSNQKTVVCFSVYASSAIIICFSNHNKINPSLIPRLMSTWTERGSWRVFFLTRTPILKFTKNNKDSSVYALYLAMVHPISQAASKALE